MLAQRPVLSGMTSSLIVHSDRGRTRWGGQYVGNAYKALLHGADAQLSHSRRGRTR